MAVKMLLKLLPLPTIFQRIVFPPLISISRLPLTI
jgi:hypothetical protein